MNFGLQWDQPILKFLRSSLEWPAYSCTTTPRHSEQLTLVLRQLHWLPTVEQRTCSTILSPTYSLTQLTSLCEGVSQSIAVIIIRKSQQLSVPKNIVSCGFKLWNSISGDPKCAQTAEYFCSLLETSVLNLSYIVSHVKCCWADFQARLSLTWFTNLQIHRNWNVKNIIKLKALSVIPPTINK